MKNYETILSEAGITMTDEQKTAIAAAMGENYKPIADWQNQVDKLANLEQQLNVTKATLAKFDGVDVAAKDGEISTLKQQLADMEKAHQDQMADRDFRDVLKTGIVSAKGLNEKAIMALLDLEELRKSKNQKDDVAAALKTLAEAEDSKMLFGEPEVKSTGSTINTIGTVTKTGGDSMEAAMRAAMGLPAVEQK